MSDYVQAIAVLKNAGTHDQVVRAVARCSVGAYYAGNGSPSWNTWLEGAFTKSVRRGTQAQLDELRPLARYGGKVGEVEVLAFDPMPYDKFPPALTKMQVSNYNRPRTYEGHYDRNPMLVTPTLWINDYLNMSTGKTAAQAAHGLMAWVIKWGIKEFNPPHIFYAGYAEFKALLEEADVVINDAGKTEIEPGSATVLVTHTV